MNPILREKARRVRMLLMDVDGVLTDGTFERRGDDEVKRFHSRDGLGLVLARRAGLKVGLISGRRSSAVAARAEELAVDFVRLGVGDKLAAFEEAIAEQKLAPEEVAFIGDDLTDLPVLRRVGLAIAVADAHPEVTERVDYVTRMRGGYGAVRESVDQILMAQNLMERLLEPFTR